MMNYKYENFKIFKLRVIEQVKKESNTILTSKKYLEEISN